MDVIYVRANNKYYKISVDEILYLKAAGSYLKLVTTEAQYSIAQNLSQFLRKNPLPSLMRVHRSYVANMNQIDSFDRHYIFMRGYRIPIGDNHKAPFLRKVHLL